ncbi:MAG TPA: hypothetical protein VFG66_08595 [Gemmatimonadales bacterium]|nr:hypothetical protein [Gemmatimonadales bacterium]
MHTLIRSAALAAILAGTGSADLVAQSDKRDASANPACTLLMEQEIDAATGLDYGPGEALNAGEEGFGGTTCLWDTGPVPVGGKIQPQVGIVFMPRFYGSGKPRAGCTREPLRGVGDVAFTESCKDGVQVYVKTGKNDFFVSVDILSDSHRTPAWAQPVAVALAKAAAPRARNK